MLSRGWLSYAALTGWLIAANLLVWLMLAPNSPRQGPSYPSKAQSEQLQTNAALSASAAEQKPPAVTIESADGGRAEYRNEADLDAQQRMADGTEALVWFAERQNFITGVEAFLLFLTVGFSAVASIAASIAAKAAQNTVKVTEDIAKLELRAYISFRIAEMRFNDEHSILEMHILITNSGGTSGQKLSVRSALKPLPFPIPETISIDRIGELDKEFSDVTIHPGQTISSRFRTKIRVDNDLANALECDDTRCLTLIAEATYTDRYDDPHVTRFCEYIYAREIKYVLKRPMKAQVIESFLAEHHNDAT